MTLEAAEAAHRSKGHENLGFLSEHSGFMPQQPPAQRLPPEFAAWDEVARELPRLYGTLSLRRRLDRLPNLRRPLEHLPDEALLRASNVLSVLAHAYQYVETLPPDRLPRALTEPWTEVRRRLERPDAVLSYIDLIVYNFRLVDAGEPDPFRVENMRLLTPTVDTTEERVFYLTQTEILAQTSPIIGAVVRAQEAVVRDDPAALKRELRLITECLDRVVRSSLLKINPNPSGPNHVDPVVWAKTVAPFAVPIEKGVQGPSGTSSPLFSLLDAFFGRTRHESFLGREIRDLRRGYPRFWREFLGAVGEVSTAEYVARVDLSELSGVFRAAIAAYVGHDGFLGRHRMKVYGYLELAFKVGRSVTIGGFAGLFKDRTWDQVDSELEYSRRERFESFPEACHLANVQPAQPLGSAPSEGVRRVLLGVAGCGLRYEPGDRCGILAENSEELCERTLTAFGAAGDEAIELTSEWREHLRLRPGFEGRTWLPFCDLLRFGRIRPVVPRVAEALHAATQYPALLKAIVNQTTSQWELWELLLELRESGHALERLWSGPSASAGYVSRVVPPENFRMYSISSAMPPGDESAAQLELTVGLVRYRSPTSRHAPEVVRSGTASNFLGAAGRGHTGVPFIVQHPPRFGLPRDPATPIVMVAGGSGIAPFLSFIRQRRAQPSGPTWLFWGLRSRADFVYQSELAAGVAAGKLELDLAFSQEDVRARFVADGHGAGHFEYEPAARGHVDRLLLAEPNREILTARLRSKLAGGLGAHVYTCGRSGFARSVEQALRELLARTLTDASERALDAAFAELAGEGRYLREIYTDPLPADESEPQIDISRLVTKNDDRAGYWLAIDGRVYDLTSFLGMHPGGLKVLRGYAGMDATQGYLRAHQRATEVHAMREMYAIGKLRSLDFKNESRLVEREQATQRMSVATLYRAWRSFTFLAVEMQNALRNDLGFKDSVTARDEPASPRSPYKIERLIETQERFLNSYTSGLAGTPAIELWELTEGLYRGRASEFMRDAVAQVQNSTAATYVAGLTARLRTDLQSMLSGEGEARSELSDRLLAACDSLEAAAAHFLAHVKSRLRDALILFEQHEADVLEAAGGNLLSLLGGLPDALAGYLFDVQQRLQALGYSRLVRSATDDEPIGEGGGPTSRNGTIVIERPRVLTCTRYWLMEFDDRRDIVFLRRSAEALLSLTDLVRENERIIDKIQETRSCRGVVVDTRQAPPRNDTDFEEAMRRMRNEVCVNYARVAVLIVSAVGVLQVARLGRDDDAPTLVTQSEEAAIQFAMGQA